MRGGEKCLEALSEIYPDAVIHTLFLERSKVSRSLLKHEIRVSPLQQFPFIFSSYRNYLPFFPWAVGCFDLREFDLVISTSHCVAKGVRKKNGAKHLSYCFTPMRYAWGFFDDYFGGQNPIAQAALRVFLRSLRQWDRRSSKGVDHFVAISGHVKNRIETFYGREAQVIFPPADTVFYAPDTSVAREDFYLIVSALVPYKKIDLAVRALAKLGRKLVVIGSGPERESLEKIAGSATRFLGWQPDETIRDHYRRARALVFPGEEDFGIVPVEAQACGAPVIAYGRGGVLETVGQKSGIFFNEQTPEALIDAVQRFESSSFDPVESRANAVRFARDRFKAEIEEAVRNLVGAS